MTERQPLLSGESGRHSSQNSNHLSPDADVVVDTNHNNVSAFASEFRCSNIGFSHPRKDVFYSCQWDWAPFVFVCYRLVVASYAVLVVVLSTIHFHNHPLPYCWMCWLTNWSFTLLTAYLVVAAMITTAESITRCRCFQRHSLRTSAYSFLPDSSLSIPSNPLPIYIKFQWLLFDIACPAAFIVSIVFFTALYPQLNPGKGLSFENATVHVSNSIIVVLELCLNAIPVRLLHAFYLFLYGVAYTTFSLIFWGVDHDNVLYPKVLDWNHPGTTSLFVVLLATVGIGFLQLVFFAVYKFRLFVYTRIYGTGY